MGNAVLQGQIWGVRARAWAEVQEPTFIPIIEAVLQKIYIGVSTSVLDIGCGSGVFCEMAMRLGAQVSGLDASEPLLDIARQRVPNGDFRAGEMEELPYADETFDIVTGFNAFPFAASPVNALREARRVTRKGGSLVIGLLGKPEGSDFGAYFTALGSLLPAPPPEAQGGGQPGPFALSVDGALEALVAQAGMKPGKVEELDFTWEYPDEGTMLRGLLSSGPGIRAIEYAGEAAARDALVKALAPFKTALGGYVLRNKGCYMIVKI
jgi:SAM-dependent methyltransferase